MINSSSPSPAFSLRSAELENDLTACVLAGFQVACNKEVLAEDCLDTVAESRETVRGAERANDLIENMVEDVMKFQEFGMIIDLFC
jgi:hypothetical protein